MLQNNQGSTGKKYEQMLQKYKTQKEVQSKVSCKPSNPSQVRQAEQFNTLKQPPPGPSNYLNFLEKQIERTNSACLQVQSLDNGLGSLRERMDLLELT